MPKRLEFLSITSYFWPEFRCRFRQIFCFCFVVTNLKFPANSRRVTLSNKKMATFKSNNSQTQRSQKIVIRALITTIRSMFLNSRVVGGSTTRQMWCKHESILNFGGMMLYIVVLVVDHNHRSKLKSITHPSRNR